MRVLSFDIGIKCLAYCDLSDCVCAVNEEMNFESNKQMYKINDWNVCNISEQGHKHDINVAIGLILDFLNERFAEKIQDYDHIVLENQPVIKNPVMKSIQVIIFTFFHMLKKQKAGQQGIHFISAMNKCKVIKRLDSELAKKVLQNTENESKSNKGYKYNKKLAHHLCTVFVNDYVESNSQWKETYNAHKKNDDLADSFLQGIYFIHAKDDDRKDQELKAQKKMMEKEKKQNQRKNEEKHFSHV
jgi:hypothetical protein